MVSFETPIYTAQCDSIGALNVLEAMRKAELTNARFIQVGAALGLRAVGLGR